ncbi:MAG TPA: M6 family metalloprotease domain-containing protein [bacterium]|nr:M6 family metalloprotease domain-containing protein [bacterium]
MLRLLIVVAIAAATLAGSACSTLGVTARPGPRTLLGASVAPTYFRIRPNIVDLPESPARLTSAGTSRALVLLVDFSDKPADRTANTPGVFQQKLFASNGRTLKSYFLENSYGRFSLDGDVFGWFRADCRHRDIVNRDLVAGTKDDHGLDTSSDAIMPSLCQYPLNIWGLVKNVIALADSTVDFSAYDANGDGFVDALIIVHAGIGAEIVANELNGHSEDYIWSLQSDLDYYAPTRGTAADGVRIGPFVIVPEISEIGVFAHEFCHLLGLPDLYNSVTGVPVAGDFCLMDGGAWLGPQGRAGSVPGHLSTFMKSILGWIEPQEVCLGCGGPDSMSGAEFEPLSLEASAHRLLSNPGGVDWTPDGRGQGEYFILENRQNRFGDFDSYLSGHGLVIWKIDESERNNNTAGRRLAEVIRADGGSVDSDAGLSHIPGEPSDFWPGTLGKQAFTPYSDPPSSLGGNRFSGASAEDIAEDPTGLVTANLKVGLARRGKTYAFPNPYNLSETAPMRIVFLPQLGPAEPYDLEVTVFDLEGNPVRRLDERPREVQSDGTALWDGRDENGKTVKPGLYIYYARASGQEASGIVAIKP